LSEHKKNLARQNHQTKVYTGYTNKTIKKEPPKHKHEQKTCWQQKETRTLNGKHTAKTSTTNIETENTLATQAHHQSEQKTH
jgi:hypothetical protein